MFCIDYIPPSWDCGPRPGGEWRKTWAEAHEALRERAKRPRVPVEPRAAPGPTPIQTGTRAAPITVHQLPGGVQGGASAGPNRPDRPSPPRNLSPAGRIPPPAHPEEYPIHGPS